MKRICSLSLFLTSKFLPFRCESGHFPLCRRTLLDSWLNELGTRRLQSLKLSIFWPLDRLRKHKCKPLVLSRQVCWSISSRLSQWKLSLQLAKMTKQSHPKHPCLKGTFSCIRKFFCKQLKFMSLGRSFSKFWQLQLEIRRLLFHLKSSLNP